MGYPKFLCVGAAKAGTTSLQDILFHHPEVYLPKEKELQFFSDNDLYAKGLEWYKQFFPDAETEGKLVGEICPAYMSFHRSIPRIHQDLGSDTKIIFMMRNPMDRAFSNYLHYQRRTKITETNFKKLLLKEEVPFLRAKGEPGGDEQTGYLLQISIGLYYKHIQAYLKCFPIENMYFIRFEEDFLKNQEECLSGLCDFLGIEKIVPQKTEAKNQVYQPKFMLLNKMMYGEKSLLKQVFGKLITSHAMKEKVRDALVRFNSSKDKVGERLSKEDREWLYEEFFQEDIEKTEALIGKDLSSWKIS